MDDREYSNVYTIPPNYTDSDTFCQGGFKKFSRNRS